MESPDPAKKKRPSSPEVEGDTDVRSSLRPPGRKSSPRSQEVAATTSPRRSTGTGDVESTTSPTKKLKKKKKTKTPKAPKKEAQVDDGAVGTSPRRESEKANKEAAAAAAASSQDRSSPSSPTKRAASTARALATVDDAQHVARADDASVMTDDTLDDGGGKASNGNRNGKTSSVKENAVREDNVGEEARSNKTQKGNSNEKKMAGRAWSGDEQASTEADAKAAVKKGSGDDKHDGGANGYGMSVKQLEKERRANAQAQMITQHDDEQPSVAPTTLARANTGRVSLPGAFRVQPSRPSSGPVDDAAGPAGNNSPHDADVVGSPTGGASPRASSSRGGRWSRFRVAGSTPTTTSAVDAPAGEDDVIDAEAQVRSPSVVAPDEEEERAEISAAVSRAASYKGYDYDECATSNGGDGLTVPIVAEIVPNDEEMARRLEAEMKEKVKMEVDARLERERKSQVVAEAVYLEDSKLSGEGRFSTRLKLTVLAVVCIVIIIIAVTAAVVSGNNDELLTTVTPAPTSSPTFVVSDEFKEMVDAIGGTVTSDPTVFQNKSTAQYAAMNWLANEDTYFVDVSLDSLDSRVLVERYVMAVFYFATSGASWRNQYSFLTPISVCSWSAPNLVAGVWCDDGIFLSTVAMSKYSGCCW
jgi:hypothetical protein